MEPTIEDAEELRDELETTAGILQVFINKLNQLIDGEITEDEYLDWLDDNEEMFVWCPSNGDSI